MPSSRARRRRAQQRRGAAAQAPPRRPPAVERPTEPEPASVEEAQSLEPVREQAGAEPIEAVDSEEAVDELEPEGDLTGDAEEWGEPGEDETLEEQEADVEEAVAELEQAPASRGRRSRPGASSAVAERARPAARAASRNRRRGATPQPQGPALVRFFRETFDELRKVDWPTPSELYRYTIIVIITVIVLAAFISGLDWVLQQLAQRFVYGGAGATG